MVKIRSKLVDPRGGHNRYSCNFDFFKQWNSEMAYVLGFLYADGNITNAISSRTQYIQFNNNDKEILEVIGATMGSKHPLQVVPPRTVTYRNGVYTGAESFKLRIGSRIMFNDLLNLGLIPHKSKTVLFPSVPLHYLSHFVRGYFDGDGCVFLGTAKGIIKQIIIKKLSVIFTSGSLLFLERLGEILKSQLFLNHNKIYKSSGAFQLRYSTGDSVKIFKFIYKDRPEQLYLKRKFAVFQKYFNLSSCINKIDHEVGSILGRRDSLMTECLRS